MKMDEIQITTREEALVLLLEETPSATDWPASNESVFDVYGNYSYPSDAKIKEPNIAMGYAFAQAIPAE